MTSPSRSDKFTYLSSIIPEKSPGVANKILGTLEAVDHLGFSKEWINILPEIGFLSKMAEAIDQSQARILVIRSLCQYNFYLIPALIRAKRRGMKVIFDVPTPNSTAIHELADSKSSILRKAKDLAYLILSGPAPYWFVSGVLQYAEEGAWFLVGNRSKTKLIGNGIKVNAVPMRTRIPEWTGGRLDLVCVASLNYWHGIDRLIKAIARVNEGKYQPKIFLKIIGEGAVFSQLKSQVEALRLTEYVQFLGFLTGESLYDQYATSHLAVGSLALFRKNLNTASELKSREYCAVGIPFIVVGDDPDFGDEAKFRIQLANRESIDDLVEFFEKFTPNLIDFSPEEIRSYAENHLDFSVKIRQIIHQF
jgi:glycosyltransferase involved in cell wall biosynthesis